MIKPSFLECCKRSGIVVLVWMVLHALRKTIFHFDQLVILKEQFLKTNQKLLAAVVFLITIVVIWGMISLIGGIGYYLINKLR